MNVFRERLEFAILGPHLCIEIGGSFSNFLGSVTRASLRDYQVRSVRLLSNLCCGTATVEPSLSRSPRFSIFDETPNLTLNEQGPLDGIGLVLPAPSIDRQYFDEKNTEFSPSLVHLCANAFEGSLHPIRIFFATHQGRLLRSEPHEPWYSRFLDLLIDDDVAWCEWLDEWRADTDLHYFLTWLRFAEDPLELFGAPPPQLTDISRLLLEAKLKGEYGRWSTGW